MARVDDKPEPGILRRIWRWVWRLVWGVVVVALLAILLFSRVNPPRGIYMWQETARLGGIERIWVPLDAVSPHVPRALVAAEDANFCLHWGFDMAAIRDAIDDGGRRGASTLSQQTVKNVFLWQGRSWPRKALEAGITPVVELIWTKRRILTVYMNVAEFGEGIFGVEAAARHYFDRGAADLTLDQAARLAAILPDPKNRSATANSGFMQRRSAAIADGAETIAKDGRAACFQR